MSGFGSVQTAVPETGVDFLHCASFLSDAVMMHADRKQHWEER